MSSRKTVLYAAALAGAVTLGLVGCNGGGDEPTKTATPTASASSTGGSGSPSPSASGSVTPSPSVSVSVPAAARAHTEAGAVEFAKFYILEADRAYVSLDTATLAALAGPNCEGCQSAIEGVDEFKAAGERQLRPSMTVRSTNVLPNSTEVVAQVQVQIRASEVDVENKAGKVVGSTDEGDTVYRLAVRWTDGRWTAADMGLEQ